MAAKKQIKPKGSWFTKPEVGTAFTMAAWIAFLAVCMMLPMVGQAGVQVKYQASVGSELSQAMANQIAFGAVAVISLLLSIAAIFSKLERRKLDNSPLPKLSIILCGTCVVVLLSFFTGLLGI